MSDKKWYWAVVLSAMVCMVGCAFVTVPLFPETQRLQERIIEGTGKDKILLLDISGIISEKKRRSAAFRSDVSMVENMREALKKAEHDVAIKGLIVRINSPGGSITGSDILHHELTQFKKRKNIRIMACLMDVGTSGGYYIATAADEIMAHPTTLTGSIAVIALKFNVKGLLDLVGIKEESIKSGQVKDIWSPFRPSTEAEREIMQKIIDTFHRRFVDIIVRGRKGMTKQEAEALADGRIFTADQALELKLIDRIGYVDDALRMMKQSLGIDEATIITYGRPGAYKDTIYSRTAPNFPPTLTPFTIDGEKFLSPPGLHLMYLWMP